MEDIIKDYISGLSIKEIWKKGKITRKKVTNIIRNAGILRNRSESAKIGNTKYIKSYSDEFRQNMRDKRLAYMKANPNITAWRSSTMSFPEKKFFDWISTIDKYVIIREKSFFPYFADFAILNANVVVEIDGSQHLKEKRKLKDELKDNLITSSGWRVIRFEAKEVLNNFSDVKNKLDFFLNSDNIIEKSEYINCINIRKKELEDEKNNKINIKKQIIIDKIQLIKDSGIDFYKWGSMKKISKILNICPQKVNAWLKKNNVILI